jgi:AcrR family transcriptional regulator
MVDANPSRTYGGRSADARQAERRKRLLDAGLELLGSEGATGTTVRRVCGQAGLTPRYFYESFPDLDALLVEVLDTIVAEATAEILAAIAAAPHDAHAKSRAAIATCIEFLTDDPRRTRVLFVEALGNERLMRRRLDAMHAMSTLVALQAREFYGVPTDTDPIADIAAELLVGGIAELLISWLDGGLHVTRAQLIEDVSDLFVATGEAATAIAARRAAS